jgi:uncharacterized membrane protein
MRQRERTVMDFESVVEMVGKTVDGIGIVIVVVGSLGALVPFALRTFRGDRSLDSYRSVRRNLGRAILLGLEFLVAGDIIRTVAVAPSLTNVAVLGVIVLIRTFLSASLEVEIEGRWPWSARGEGA